MTEIEQQPRRRARARHLVHRDDRHHSLGRVLDRDERDVHQTTVELVRDPVLPGVEEDALDALALQLIERLEQGFAVERGEPGDAHEVRARERRARVRAALRPARTRPCRC